MTLHFVKNPMYALCLLAAICVRQHVYNNRVDKPLTKGVSLKMPTSGLTKPNEASLKAATNPNKKPDNLNQPKSGDRNWSFSYNYKRAKLDNWDKAKLDNDLTRSAPEQADYLVQCVRKFAKHAEWIVDDLRSTVPISKSSALANPIVSSNILDTLLYLTSNVGSKWLA